MSTRRQFMQLSLGVSGLAAWGTTAPRFLANSAAHAANPAARPHSEKILVVVQLTGGNDGLNTVVPFGDDGYGRLRKNLRIPTADLKKIDNYHGLHPSLTGFADMLQEQALCIVQGVGYPNPNESHFRSLDIWQAGSVAEELREGWLGKALVKLPGAGAFQAASQNETNGLAFAGSPAKVPSISNLEQFQLELNAAGGTDRTAQRQVIEHGANRAEAASTAGRGQLLDFVCRTAVNTYSSSRKLCDLAKNYQPKVPYPQTGLANRLKLIAQLIEADVGARIFYVTHDGYDTHASQLPLHANLLAELSGAMTAFYKDMAARGNGDRLLMMTFSEFGRRAKENDSGGTDHGSAEPLFIIGKQVKPGLVGKHPSLTDLYLDKLKHHTDFRQVYATILDQWLSASSEAILGEKFTHLPILKTA